MDSKEAREPLTKLYRDALAEKQRQFAGQVHNETDERSVRLTALIEATFELYRAHVPGMVDSLKDIDNRRNAAHNLTVEYMPILMLDPDELPRVFAEYALWQYGTDQAAEHLVDIEYLKDAFKRGISRLPDETREGTIADKHRFDWGKLI